MRLLIGKNNLEAKNLDGLEVVDLVEELDRVLAHVQSLQPDLYQVLEGKHAYTNYRVAERLKGLIESLENKLEEE